MQNIFEAQYEQVRQSREVLFQYCNTISQKDFIRESSSFGRGSIRNLLVHTGNTYEFWIGKQALQRDGEFMPYASVTTISELYTYYDRIDELVHEFLHRFASHLTGEIPVHIDDTTRNIAPLQLFTHVITHEFHHKGQVLSLSRHLGYTPVDTDIIR
ncbi:DinB family protein [Sinomicrobium kalidii]|uniref:DinB family protein n=1 Tax=Sinomicrobium kalidii TaxID=2900738 RepID=UPI001E3A5A34|nr:DinB family protein [Sinomicrobium kalidii]UGU15256.1 DinB family protein [Sinomicrobium kalidii]